jgi:AcrR family transcriptional regulator
MRVVKKPEERKNELLDIAEDLFKHNDYEKVNVSDIVKKADVSQGIFYYYFKSKDEIFVTIFERQIKEYVAQFYIVLNNNDISAVQKLKQIVKLDYVLNRKHDDLIRHLHREENAGLHQKVVIAYITNYKPVV